MADSALIIVGASARAAAFSALRANYQPWCADLFADVDLQEVCPVTSLPRRRYPQGLAAVLRQAPQVPWIYTGALENQPALVRQLAALRPLWGNAADVLRRVRQPWRVEAILRAAGLASPQTWAPTRPRPNSGRWLVKPLAGAGGRGIAQWDGKPDAVPAAKLYLQEFIEGRPCGAVYFGHGGGALLLGVTRQLIGEPWLFASGYHYCGSIGPLDLSVSTRTIFAKLGDVLTASFGLRGLFGVDCVLKEGVPYPVEINPRYTASIEVLELALGIHALALHRRAFLTDPVLPDNAIPTPPASIVGKAIVFARGRLTVPARGPWSAALDQPCTEFRPFADIPRAGQTIEPGEPVMTVFARAASESDCLAALRHRVQDLDRFLVGR